MIVQTVSPAANESPSVTISETTSPWERRWLRALVLIGGVFMLHLCLRSSVLTMPPYWDCAQGLYPEALWLLDNEFDYGRLATKERRYMQGGAATYIWSVQPTLLAYIIKATPSATASFVVIHLLNFLMAGILAFVVYESIYSLARQSSTVAFAAVGVLLLQPMFGAMIDLINMELPVAVAVFSVVIALQKREWRLAAGLAMLAVFVKESGVVIAAVAVAAAVLYFFANRGGWLRAALTVLMLGAPILVVFAVEAIVMSGGGSLDNSGNHDAAHRLGNMLEVFGLIPVIYSLIIVCVLLVPVVLWRQKLIARARAEGLTAAVGQLVNEPVLWLFTICSLVSAAWIPVHWIFGHVLVRYMAWFMPCFVIHILLTGKLLKLHRGVKWTALVLLVTYQIVNQTGFVFRQFEGETNLSGHLRERSREVVGDVRLAVESARWLDEHAGDRPVIVSPPFDRAMMDPRIGYVSRPMNLYSGYNQGIPSVPPFLQMTPEQYFDAYILYFPTIYTHPSPRIYGMGGSAQTVQEFRVDEPQVFVYQVVPPPNLPAELPANLGMIYQNMVEQIRSQQSGHAQP